MTETRKKPETGKKPARRKPIPAQTNAAPVPDKAREAPEAAVTKKPEPHTPPRVARSVSQLASNSAQRLPVTKKVDRWQPPLLLDMSNGEHSARMAELKNDPKVAINNEQTHWAMDPVSGTTTMMVYIEYTRETIEQVVEAGEVARFEKEIDDLGF